MAGGKGTRLGGLKKPFLSICGKRLIDVVLGVATGIRGKKKIYICLGREDSAVLGNTLGDSVEVIVCPGAGYVDDLNYILSIVDLPALVLPADMPFLSKEIVEEFLIKAQTTIADVITLVACRKSVCRETGISFFRKISGDWVNIYFDDRLELLDVDTHEELAEVLRICGSTEAIEKQD